jgi:amino acid adenylation domain-containing protein
MIGHYRTLLEGLIRTPEELVGKLPMLGDDELETVTRQWNDTSVPYVLDTCLHELFERQVARTPAAPALIYGEQQLSYRELDEKANQLARVLIRAGVGPEKLVGIAMERSIEMVVSLLAVLKAGGAYVPLDPGYPPQRLTMMMEDAAVPVLLTQEHLVDRLPKHHALTLCVDREWDEIERESPASPSASVGPDNLSYVIFTSGSTGRPKGAMNTHRAICNRLLWMQDQYGLQADDRVLQKTPFSFDVSVWEFFWPLITGARLVVAKPEGHRDGAYLVRLIRGQGITTLHFVPSMLQVFLEENNLESCNPCLKRVICSGEALSFALKERFFSRLHAELHNLYGPTEAAVDVTYWQCSPGDDLPFVPIGRPVANTQIYILDRFLQPVPMGVAGELHIGGVQVGRGYLNRPELTAQKFIPDPFAQVPGARLYKSGDLARYTPTGEIEYLGRIDHQVKVRGFRIELGEIESVLEQHNAVRAAVVTVRDDGAAEKQLVAYVVPKLDDPPAIQSGVPRVEEVQSIFDQTYTSAKITDLMFDPSGWNSSYTGLPLPDVHIREWLDGVVERIAALRAKDVLEIGCGTGMLLFRLAHAARRYVACDVSEVAIRQLEATLRLEEYRIPQVEPMLRPAHDLGDLPRAGFDVVIMNSVAQYFPSVEYLLEVLDAAVERVRPGGHVFVGDVRSLPLLRMFHASVETSRASGTISATELLKRVERKIELEEELAISSELFALLPRFMPRLRDVEIQLKRGRHDNEMTRFRYDVVLHVGHCRDRPTPRECDWAEAESGLDGLRHRLQTEAPDSLRVRRIPNARIAKDCRALEILKGNLSATMEQVRNRIDDEPARGIDPEDVWDLGTEMSYEVSITWSDDDGYFDACFDRKTTCAAPHEIPEASPRVVDRHELRRLANDPRVGLSARRLIPELRLHLKEKLPDYMVPNALWVMSAFPLSPNGKVDRRALPAPDLVRVGIDSGYVAPRTELELTLADIWGEVLGTDRIGIRDNFFDLGGDSILNIRIVARANELRIGLTPLLIFKHQTIEALAKVIGEDAERATEAGVTRTDQSDSSRGTVDALPAEAGPAELGSIAGLSSRELQAVLRGDQDVEEIYQLAPLQEGMLFHALYESGSGLYCVQLSGDLPARLDTESFAAAWRQIINRHATLRTRFAWDGLRHPVQVVCKNVRMPFTVEDWRNLPADEQDRRMRKYREDRDAGYSLDRAPPMEVRLLRLEHAHRLIWNFHHILLDGWSMIDVLTEVFAAYNQIRLGQTVVERAGHQYGEYVNWVMRQNSAETKRYWEQELGDFVEPTRFCDLAPPPDTPNLAANYSKLTFALPQPVPERLSNEARRNRLTVNTLVHAAWSLLLWALADRDDVVFGTVVPGRPPSLRGAEAIVGLLINTLPARVQVPADAIRLAAWLHELQDAQTRMREHGFVSLSTLQQWSGVPTGQPLFESFIAVQGYLRDNGSLEQWASGLGLTNIELIDWNNLPLSLAVEVGVELKALIKYDRARIRVETAQAIAADLQWLLLSMSEGLDKDAEDLKRPLRERSAKRAAEQNVRQQRSELAALRSTKRRAIVSQGE